MAENSAIEWCDHTFNPWIGCQKVSPACDHCYAEAMMDTRLGQVEWGPGKPRKRTSAANWNQPFKWDKAAKASGQPAFVFCASLADVFDNAVDPAWRDDLWNVIGTTRNLVWLLLTKRPQNIAKMLPSDWGDGWPHVWLGTTVEDQARAELNIPALVKVPAVRRFLSCEPLLKPLNLRSLWVGEQGQDRLDALSGHEVLYDPDYPDQPDETAYVHVHGGPKIDWVICGGESGPDARPMHPDWARSLRDQCAAAPVPFFFKQWGRWAPGECVPDAQDRAIETGVNWFAHRWHSESWTRAECAELHIDDAPELWEVPTGKAAALLDGQSWDERPAALSATHRDGEAEAGVNGS